MTTRGCTKILSLFNMDNSTLRGFLIDPLTGGREVSVNNDLAGFKELLNSQNIEIQRFPIVHKGVVMTMKAMFDNDARLGDCAYPSIMLDTEEMDRPQYVGRVLILGSNGDLPSNLSNSEVACLKGRQYLYRYTDEVSGLSQTMVCLRGSRPMKD